MISSRMSRRRFMLNTAAMATAATAATAAPYIKSGFSAGSLTLGLWDHWIPGSNEIVEEIVLAWGAANNVDVTVDFITSIGNKLMLTAQAESRAGTGHDIYSVPLWMPSIFRDTLIPVDDVVAEIQNRHGPFVEAVDFLGRFDGVWRAVPAANGALTLPPVSRLDMFKEHAGVDLQAIFPASPDRDPALVDAWTYDAYLAAAQALYAAGFPVGGAVTPTPDGTNWIAAAFAAFGADLIDAEGEITVDSDAVREVLEYFSRLTQVMDPSIYAWDDAANNRWLISGRGSSIFNPPSAWAVAKRDAPEVAAQLWHHDAPRGPKGRFRSGAPFFWGIWNFSTNASAAKDLCLHMMERPIADRVMRGSQGYDLPLIKSFYEDNDIWESAGPPDGVLYNYPLRGDEIQMAPGYPAMPEFASLMATQGVYPNLVAQVTQGGDSFDDAISWAENELEGLMRS